MVERQSDLGSPSIALGHIEDVFRVTNTVIVEVDLANEEVEYFGPIEAVTGVQESELGDPFTVSERIVHPEDQSKLDDAFESLLAGEQDIVEIDYKTHPDNGPVRWLRIQAHIEGAPDDGLTLIGLSTDITEQKRQEARLEQFAEVVAHDLRNPLTVAENRLELASDACDSEHHEKLGTALDRMNDIIDDVLWLASEGQDIGITDRVLLDVVVEAAWSLTGEEYEGASLVIEETGGGLRSIEADAERLQQLFENLFRNAVEHGGPEVTVRVGREDGYIFVEDDGSGIAEDDRTSVFEPGYSTAYNGTGFGLTIVEQIADGHGWDIRLTEQSSGGAHFEIGSIESDD